MTPELAEVYRRVQEEIEAQLVALERLGPGYTREFLESTVRPRRLSSGRGPVGMRPEVAKMIREIALDELAFVRRVS